MPTSLKNGAETTVPSEPLHVVLQDEYYLPKILRHLVEDGLHECRRVCRQWYEICSKLPVQLEDVPVDKLPLIVDKFPYASSMSVSRRMECQSDANKHEVNPQSSEALSVEEAVLRYVAPLKSLKHLEVTIDSNQSLPEALECCFRSLLHLESLGICLGQVDGSSVFFDHLRLLTNLTCLKLQCETLHYRWELCHPEPFTELQGIRDLSVPYYLFDVGGQLMFPSLTNLTRLYLNAYYVSRSQQDLSVPQVGVCSLLSCL